ncbi:DUF5689 domain-containing protein [Formosa sp. S-31]|uniref:DUF5689 domain-containing protein n=1 Tax=Formosa sp. S-31 TaxID=2790949 RepID=UPI003EBBA3FC
MRTIRILELILHYTGCLVLLCLASCVQDDDFSVPKSLGEEENKGLTELLQGIEDGVYKTITVAELKQQFVPGEVKQFQSNSVLKAYVTSSDRTGNFYKELFVQDQPVQPTAGINIVLNQVDSYNQFNVGREVYIVLKDLYLGETASEIPAIGGLPDGDRVDLFSEYQIKTHVFRTSETLSMEPLEVQFTDLNDNFIGVYVSINHVEFPENLEGQSYFNSQDDFDTHRKMQRCDGFGYESFILETSSFATFKNEILPVKNGTIKGVVSRSYGGDDLVLILNDSDDVQFANERCTPLSTDDFTVVYQESFSDATDDTILDTAGWINFSERGQVLWTEQIYSKNGYAEFGTFGANDTENVAWLISPRIDMTSNLTEYLNFKMAQHHLDSVKNKVEVLVSTNFNGVDVLSAIWEPIEAKLPTKYDEWYTFKDSGLIDISNYQGILYVAFKVTGSGTNEALDGSYQLDDFRVLLQD